MEPIQLNNEETLEQMDRANEILLIGKADKEFAE